MASRLFRHTVSFVFACAAAQAHAVELGEAKVNSYIGQQLVADIELTSLQDQAASVQARLASRDVYQGAGIDMPAVLSSLNMNVMRREGKQFLHLTSLKPVEADHLHVYLELSDGGQKTVRLATLWFTPDPTPPAPVTAPVPLPVVPKEPAPPPLAWAKPKPVRPAAAPLPRPQPEAACRREPSKAEAVCAALDGKNAELQAKLLLLEGRVRALQAEAQAAPEPPKPPEPPAQKEAAASHDSASAASSQPAGQPIEAKAATPAPAPVHPEPKPAASKPAASKPAPPEPGMPWGWIAGAGAAVFALVGGWQFWRSKRKGAKAKPAKRVEPSDTKAQEAEASEAAAG